MNLRFANIFQMTNKSVAKMWTVVKKVKRETSPDKQCCSVNLILFGEPSDWASQVKAVEQELQIESTDATFQNMTSTNLEAAAEMFIYLNMCPGQVKALPRTAIHQRYQSWFRLYDELFKNKSPDVIILTLNRLLTQTDHKHKIIKRNKVLFKTGHLCYISNMVTFKVCCLMDQRLVLAWKIIRAQMIF